MAEWRPGVGRVPLSFAPGPGLGAHQAYGALYEPRNCMGTLLDYC